MLFLLFVFHYRLIFKRKIPISAAVWRPEFGTATTSYYKVGADGTKSSDKKPEPTEPLFDPIWHFWCPETVFSFTCRDYHTKISQRQLLKDWRSERPLHQRMTVRAGDTMFFSPWHPEKAHLWLSCVYVLICVPYIGRLLSVQKLLQLQLHRSQEVKQPKVDTARKAESAWVVARWEENAVSVKPQGNSELVPRFNLCSEWRPRKFWVPEH